MYKTLGQYINDYARYILYFNCQIVLEALRVKNQSKDHFNRWSA